MDIHNALENDKETQMKEPLVCSDLVDSDGEKKSSKTVGGLSWKVGIGLLVTVALVFYSTNLNDKPNATTLPEVSKSEVSPPVKSTPFGSQYPLLDNGSVDLTAVATETEGSFRCQQDTDCTTTNRPKCLLESGRDKPAKHVCYECITNDDCAEPTPLCAIDVSGTCCSSVEVDQIPGMSRIERGYNIFKADPFGVKNNLHDEGVAKRPFYVQTFNTDPKHWVTMSKETYSMPQEFHVYNDNRCEKKYQTSSITSTESFQTAMGSAVHVEGEATIPTKSGKKINVGASIGMSSYSDVMKAAEDGLTTTESTAYCTAYQFNMKKDASLYLTDEAKAELKKLSTTSDKQKNEEWKKFFNQYGTHVIVSGQMGAYERVYSRFTKTQRNDVTKSGYSFEQSVSVGIEGIFSVSKSESQSVDKTKATSKNEEKFVQGTVSSGDVDDTLMNPGLIKMSVMPICEFFQDQTDKANNKIFSVVKETCKLQMLPYCRDILFGLLPDPEEVSQICNYEALGKPFQCVTDADCEDEKATCSKGQCSSCSEWKVKIHSYTANHDDAGAYGEYVFTLDGEPYWQGDLSDNGDTTYAEKGWEEKTFKKGKYKFVSWEEDTWEWNKFLPVDVEVGYQHHNNCATHHVKYHLKGDDSDGVDTKESDVVVFEIRGI